MNRLGYARLNIGRTDSVNLPEWAEFVDIISDGGIPFLMHVQGPPILVRTGDRIPITVGALQFENDPTFNTITLSGPSTAVIALISMDVARVMPPPSKNASEIAPQKETVVQSASARVISQPPYVLSTDDGISITNLGAQTCYVGRTAAEATAQTLPIVASGVINWTGPLFVFNPAGVNVDLSLGIKVKRP